MLGAFRRLRPLRWLNDGAVGASLAACTTAVLANLGPALALALPTLVIGVAWMRLLRRPATMRAFGREVRRGWLLSVPLAALNAGVACALARPHEWPAMFLLGISLGAIVWGPALVATLLCFGVPVAWSQSLARKGLAGEERGEAIVGAVSAALGVAAGCVPLSTSPERQLATDAAVSDARVVVVSLACVAVVLGGAAALLALRRERLRRAVVADAEAGKLPQYRVDATAEGKVLVRLATGATYRGAALDEVCALDERGAVTTSRLEGAAGRSGE
jgi:hypothetical protein